MKLYDIVNEENALEELMYSCETLEDADALSALQVELEKALEKKSAGIIKVIKNLESDIETIKNEESRLKNLRIARQKAIENFKKYVVLNMEKLELKKIETSIGDISLRKSSSVVIDDADKVPNNFLKVEYEISKVELKKELNTREVPGAHIEVKNNLTIK
jgi:hypothetical protein